MDSHGVIADRQRNACNKPLVPLEWQPLYFTYEADLFSNRARDYRRPRLERNEYDDYYKRLRVAERFLRDTPGIAKEETRHEDTPYARDDYRSSTTVGRPWLLDRRD